MNPINHLNFCCFLLTISTTLACGCGKEPQLATAQGAPSTQPQPGASAKPPAPSFSLPAEAVEYAAKNFPRALHVPKIVLSDKLKQQSFAATIRYPEKLKQVLSLSEKKDWTGMVRLILSYEKGEKFLIRDEYPSTVSQKIDQVESALKHLRGRYWRFPVAIQHQKDAGLKKTQNFISVILMPDREKDLLAHYRYNEFGMPTGVILDQSGMKTTTNWEPHPSKNGVLHTLNFGDYTAYYFEDWLVRDRGIFDGPGDAFEKLHEKFRDDIQSLKKLRQLGDITSSQLASQTSATVKAFKESVLAIVLQK